MNQTKTQDILAKLLATENITVIRGNVRTASFDIKGRVLTLPRWKDMTSSIEEMLMLHEVGHALFTGMEAFEHIFTKQKHLKDYVNVVEDVRIEKKMKERYPGSRKSFNVGYTELNERSFFVPKNIELNKLLLIDRINVFFKVGYNSGVQFTPEEQAFIARVDKCDTEDDVIKLAEDIYNFSKQQKEDEILDKPKSKVVPSSDQGEEDPDEEDEEDSEEQSSSHPLPSSGDEEEPEKPKLTDKENEQVEEDLKSKTVENFNDNIEDKIDDVSDYKYYDLKFEYETNNDVIIPHKQIYTELTKYIPESYLASQREKFQKFKSNSAPMVNYLIKEFEMRKSATAYKRAKISKLGQLDPRKLYAYKIKEDLFKQITTVQDGKKHGMIFLLDWSGSMRDYIDETIQQVVNLAMFCQRVQIPYQVFAFTDGYHDIDTYRYSKKVSNKNGVDDMNSFRLLELFTNKMSSSEFNRQLELILAQPYRRLHYKLNGTPLNQALLYMVDYAGKFKRNNQVEKLSFITLTDGESNGLSCDHAPIRDGMTYARDAMGYDTRRVNRKSFFHDDITKKDYAITDDSCQQTSVLLQIISDRHDATSIGFYVTSIHDVPSFIRNNMKHMTSGAHSLRIKIVEKLKKDKFAIMTNVPGRNELYVIASDNTIEELDLSNIDDSMSASQIATKLTKSMIGRKQSRIVLNSFVGQIA